MRILTLAAPSAALWIFVVSCTSDGPSIAGSTSSGSTSSGSTGSGSTGSGGSTVAAIIDNFCNSIKGPFCEADHVCCTDPRASYYESVEACEMYFIPQNYTLYCAGPTRLALEAGLASGEIVFDQAQFDACLARFKLMAAGGSACVAPPEYAFHTMCEPAFRGQVPAGGACSWPVEWHTNNYFPCKDGLCNHGRCVPFLKSGEVCQVGRGYPEDLPPSELCNLFQRQACKGAPAAGGDVDGGADGGAVALGTCGPQGEIGDVCNPGNVLECRSLHCDATGKCALPDPYNTGCVRF